MAIDTNKVQQQAAELSNQIWSICNDLRGGMDANEFRNYILGTIFYRYLSERTEMYMQDLLKEDNISYEDAWADEEYREAIVEESLRDLGKLIRYWPTFPHGANVTFWKQTGQNHVKVVTYERGVEDFTLACGTGAGSTAYVLRKLGIAEPGVVQLDFPGGELQVSLIEEEDRITDLYLTGPAAVVSVGECFPSP